MLEEQRLEAEQVLSDLLTEELIPFPLNVGEISKEIDGYTIHFHDSRIHSARIPLVEGQSFKDACRVAVLHRVAIMSGPLINAGIKGSGRALLK
jgi:hypothetical protein